MSVCEARRLGPMPYRAFVIVTYDHESGHAFNGTPGTLFACGMPQAWLSHAATTYCHLPLVPPRSFTANGSPARLSRLRRQIAGHPVKFAAENGHIRTIGVVNGGRHG